MELFNLFKMNKQNFVKPDFKTLFNTAIENSSTFVFVKNSLEYIYMGNFLRVHGGLEPYSQHLIFFTTYECA